MITDAFINVIIAPIYSLFELLSLPVIDNIEMSDDVFSDLSDALYNIAYFVPLRSMLFMLSISWALDHFAIIWSLILRIKSFIPGMGN